MKSFFKGIGVLILAAGIIVAIAGAAILALLVVVVAGAFVLKLCAMYELWIETTTLGSIANAIIFTLMVVLGIYLLALFDRERSYNPGAKS